MDNKKKINVIIFTACLMMCLSISSWAANTQVGEVLFSRGVVTAGPEGGDVRFLGKGEALYKGDVITTGEKSFTIIHMIDDSKITIRPETVFVLEEYDIEKDRESAVLRLFKGGIRAVTGLIAKRNPRTGYRLQTPTAVLGVRGTEFDARLCEEDCGEQTGEAEPGGVIDVGLPVVGRVQYLEGSLTARSADGSERTVVKGGPVYEGDTLETDSRGIAVMVFRDNSRVTLQEGSQFKVDQYRYEEEDGDNVFFRMLRGGMRVFSGLVAKRNARSFKVGTPTAVVGIRGTGFDMLFQGSLPNDEQGPSSQGSVSQVLIEPLQADPAAGTPQGDGMFVQVWEGAIAIQLDSGILVIEQGQTVFVPVMGTPSLLPNSVIPSYVRENPAPRPDELEVDIDNLFGVEERTYNPPGLYVSVYDGHVTLENEAGSIELGGGEAGFVDMLGNRPIRLLAQPLFQVMDMFPLPDDYEEYVSEPEDNFLNDSGLKDEDRECNCEIQ